MIPSSLVSCGVLLVPLALHGCGGGGSGSSGSEQTVDSSTAAATEAATGDENEYSYETWSQIIKAGVCDKTTSITAKDFIYHDNRASGIVHCEMLADGVKEYRFPPGIFEIDEQLLVPEKTSIIGAANPNDMSNPRKSPDWSQQTLFLATKGETDYYKNYCHAKDMVKTRVGFVLSSYVSMRNLGYQGIDTVRPNDNGALCGGGVFETKGCAENACSASDVNNGGSDGMGSVDVVVENIRMNDYYFEEDKALMGAEVEGNTDCDSTDWESQCCFCKPNGVRSSQQGFWVPESRNEKGTRNVVVNNVVSMSNQADAINFHGNVHDSVVQNAWFANTGDDTYVVWGADHGPTNITFRDSVAVDPGILRPNWYGNCGAFYGFKQALFENITCMSPTLEKPMLAPEEHGGEQRMDNSMYVIYTSFGGVYPEGNNLTIKGWHFQDLNGNAYTPERGVMDVHEAGKMVWTQSEASDGTIAPFYMVPPKAQEVHVYAVPNDAAEFIILTDDQESPSKAWQASPIVGFMGFIGLVSLAAAMSCRASAPVGEAAVEMADRC